MIRGRKGWGSDRGCGKGICNQEPSPIYSTSPKPLPSISSFPIATAAIPLKGFITPWLSHCNSHLSVLPKPYFRLHHSLNRSLTHSLTDPKLLPHYLSEYKLPGLWGPLKARTKLSSYPWLSISLFRVFYATYKKLNYVVFSISATCFSAVWSLTSSPLQLFSFPIMLSPPKIVMSFKAQFKCNLSYKSSNPTLTCSSLCPRL